MSNIHTRHPMRCKSLATVLLASLWACGSVQSLPDASPSRDGSEPVDGSGSGSSQLDASPSCTASCNGDVLTSCGSDGSAISFTCDLGCNGSGGANHDIAECNVLTPSNIPASAGICDTAGSDDLDVTGTLNIDTSAPGECTQLIPQTSGPKLCVIVHANINIATGAKVRATGSNALVLVATGQATIDGSIDASSDGSGVAGPGAPFIAASGQTAPALGDGGGGGGGAVIGGASTGGGSGGPIDGSDANSPLLAGESGGSGGSGLAAAGVGGGALQIVSCHAMTIGSTAVLDVGGAGGSGGSGEVFTCNTSGTTVTRTASGGGGGGAGGAILIEASTITAAGNVAANGGGGGAGGTSSTLEVQCAGEGSGNAVTTSSAGSNGADGGPGLTPANGGSGTPGCTFGQSVCGGGTGGAGDVANVSAGTGAQGSVCSGGGGGAVGRIRFNVRSGTSPTISGTISPAPSVGAVATHAP